MAKTVWEWIHVGSESGAYKATKTHSQIVCTSFSDTAFANPRPLDVSESQVIAFAKANRHFDLLSEWEWPNAKMTRLEKVGSGVWNITIEDAYLD